MKKYTVEKLREDKLIIFEAVMGSRAYGTSLPTSDIDIRGVYIQPIEDILGYGYVDQVADVTNDVVFYELKRFLELTSTNNPNILELLNAPKDCIIYQDPLFDIILKHRDKFITKQCRNSFAGYAIAQIKKARGYNKKMNWEEKSMVRKGVLDFCYVLQGNDSILLDKWLEENPVEEIIVPKSNEKIRKLTQWDIGLAKIDHAHDVYSMYLSPEDTKWGIAKDPEKSNDVHLWSVPKDSKFLGHLTFNKDAFSTHCKRYAEYKEWLENRNEDRFKMNKDHGKQYDSKNMMHTYRLLNMTTEIAEGKIIVRRPPDEIATLMQIRRGELDYEELLSGAETLISNLDELFNSSSLPDKIDQDFVNDLLIQIRKEKYKL